MRELIIRLPHGVMALALFAFFCAVSFVVRRVVLWRCDEEARDELAEQAKNLMTGVAATFAFFIGFAISISWGAVTAAQVAVEGQATAVHQMAWELRNIPDRAQSDALMDRLRIYADTAANDDDDFLARGKPADLPSAAALETFETALRAYTDGSRSTVKETSSLTAAVSAVVSSASGVSAVANRALPRPLVTLLFVVALLVTVVMAMSTLTFGRRSMAFVYIWCVIPALSLTVVLALAFPFALRTGLPLAPIRAVASQLAAQ